MRAAALLGSSIAILWGGAALLYGLTGDDGGPGDGAYQTGHSLAIAFAVLLLVAGLRGLHGELQRRGQRR